MQKVMLKMSMSLDGLHAMGRKTWADMSTHWPTSTEPIESLLDLELTDLKRFPKGGGAHIYRRKR
jgi:hypothetical protein